jgi:hypothetical protein
MIVEMRGEPVTQEFDFQEFDHGSHGEHSKMET